jgi:hypothetical protein
MSTEAQIRANQENAQHSTGPKTESGKAASSLNNFQHGLTGTAFYFIHGEDPEQFDRLLTGLRSEHQPTTITESILVENMARAYWLSQRALRCQHACFTDGTLTMEEQSRRLAIFLRYQTTHDRAFRNALNDLLKLRSERRKAVLDEAALCQRAEDANEAFVSQKQKEAVIALRQSAENRRQERHKWDVLLAEAKVDHQIILNSNLELDRKLAGAAQNDTLEARKAA